VNPYFEKIFKKKKKRKIEVTTKQTTIKVKGNE